MRPFPSPSVLAVSLMALIGCSEPTLKFDQVRAGMTEEQVAGIMGKPVTATQQGNAKYLEYETYDQDRWFGTGRNEKENDQWFFVRMVDGKVESFGKKGDMVPTKIPAPKAEVGPKISLDKREEVVSGRPAAPVPFDLRTELEKLEKLKKDGLITESEFNELRQRVLDKATAQ